MPSQKGRDLLLKIGDGGSPEGFITVGAARAASLSLSNRPAAAAGMDAGGDETLLPAAGGQAVQVRLSGLFKDSAAEALLRAAAFGRTAENYQLVFPNGDSYAAAFVVTEYARSGDYDGLEAFSVTLRRTGGGIFTPGE